MNEDFGSGSGSGSVQSGIAIRGFANRLLHLRFSVGVVGDISSPHTQAGDLVIIGSGSGETGSLVSLAKKVFSCGVNVALVTMKAESTIGKLANSMLVLPGLVKETIAVKKAHLLNDGFCF